MSEGVSNGRLWELRVLGAGYGILARSSGCRPEWIAALKAACQRYGERPLGTSEAEGLFAIRPGSRALDDRGRLSPGLRRSGPAGALAFHALFVGRWTYAWAGPTHSFSAIVSAAIGPERTWIRPCRWPARIFMEPHFADLPDPMPPMTSGSGRSSRRSNGADA